MIRILLYIMILASLLYAPVKRADVGKLQPVEVVLLDKSGDIITVTTDTDDSGAGKTTAEALDDLKRTSERIVYLDTAQYLLVTQSAVQELSAACVYLDPDTKLCMVSGDPDLKALARYLQVHRNYPTLGDWSQGKSIPKLPVKKFQKNEK